MCRATIKHRANEQTTLFTGTLANEESRDNNRDIDLGIAITVADAVEAAWKTFIADARLWT